MTAVDFAYHRPASLGEAVRMVGELAPDVALLAGGGSLGILLNERAARPTNVVDLNEVSELRGIREENGEIWIGAMARVYDVESSELLAELIPLLPACASTVADPSLRHRVTVGGGLAYADPSASLPTALLALEGVTVHAAGPRGERPIPIDELFVASHETSLAPDELITHVTVPVPPAGAGMAWLDLDRRHLSYSLLSVAAVVEVDDGTIRSAKVAMAGIAPTPRRLPAVENALVGESTDAEAVHEATDAEEVVDPPSDLHASADYRRRVAPVLAARAVLEAIGRTGGGGRA
jgi:carbon-monoxide dehydrogenase medium subunit